MKLISIMPKKKTIEKVNAVLTKEKKPQTISRIARTANLSYYSVRQIITDEVAKGKLEILDCGFLQYYSLRRDPQ